MDCIFCKIIKGEMPANIVYEDNNSIGFLDVNPHSKGHTLIIPKLHYNNFAETPENTVGELMISVHRAANKIIDSLRPSGMNIITNIGKDAGQIIFHTHVHLIPRYDKFSENSYKYKQGEKELITQKIISSK